WEQAIECLDSILQEKANYRDVARRLAEAKRGARKANSIFRRLASRLRRKGNSQGETEQP
ncbi:MAG: hypothetical protein JSV36_14705, partial [Anaerolineae bacterium]